MTTQYGFFIDSSRCTGCKTCELACKDYKDLTPDVSFRRIYEYAGGDWQEDNGVWHQNVFAYYLSISCNHCEDPACTKVCPSGAMHKREDGFVVVDEDVCIGCRYCEMACPFDVPRYYGDEPKIDKCTMCWDRLENGMLPACVKTCQPGALHFGPRDEMIKLGKERVEFLKSRGYDKAELYGENECGGLHILQVCKFGAEAQGLVRGAQPSPLATLSKLAQPGAGLAAAATVAGLAVSFVAALGYRRRKMTIEEAKEHWTPAQRKRGEEYLREAKKEAAEQERRENAE